MTVSSSPMPADARVAWMAEPQAGCLARGQALEMGLTERMIHTRLANGQWRSAHPGVYVVRGSPASWQQEVWASVLAAGEPVVVSHESALLMARVVADQRVPRYPITLTAGHGRHHRIDGVTVHQLKDVLPRHIQTVDGLAVSKPARAIVDMAAAAGQRWLTELVNHLITERHVSLTALSACLQDVARPGKRGVAKLGGIIDALGPGREPPHSELERLLFEVIKAGGLPDPVRQVPLPGYGPAPARADGGYLDAMMILKADGRRWHSRVRDLKRDRERDAQAARAGWLTLRFMWEQLRDEPREVVATIAEVRRHRLELLGRQED